MKKKRLAFLMLTVVTLLALAFAHGRGALAQETLGRGTLTALAWSPDGATLAVGSSVGVWLYTLDAPDSPRLLAGHSGAVLSAAFSPDGATLASASADGTVRLWDVASGSSQIVLPGDGGAVFSVAFSPEGTWLASGARDGVVQVWNAATGVALATLEGHEGAVLGVAFSPTSLAGDAESLLASASADGTIRLWDLNAADGGVTGTEVAVLEGHDNDVTAVAFSPTSLEGDAGALLASGSADDTIRLWDLSGVENGTVASVAVLEGHEADVTGVAFSPTSLAGDAGSLLASASDDGTIRLWDARSGELLRILEDHENDVLGVAFSPEGTQLASGSADNTIRLWDLTAFLTDQAALVESRVFADGFSGAVRVMAVSEDGAWLASAGEGDTLIRLWNLAGDGGAQWVALAGHSRAINSLAFSPDSARLASGSADRDIRLWNPATGATVAILQGHNAAVNSVAFNADGSRLASGDENGVVRLWDASTGQALAVWEGHTGPVEEVMFSPDNALVISRSADGTIRLWRVP